MARYISFTRQVSCSFKVDPSPPPLLTHSRSFWRASSGNSCSGPPCTPPALGSSPCLQASTTAGLVPLCRSGYLGTADKLYTWASRSHFILGLTLYWGLPLVLHPWVNIYIGASRSVLCPRVNTMYWGQEVSTGCWGQHFTLGPAGQYYALA